MSYIKPILVACIMPILGPDLEKKTVFNSLLFKKKMAESDVGQNKDYCHVSLGKSPVDTMKNVCQQLQESLQCEVRLCTDVMFIVQQIMCHQRWCSGYDETRNRRATVRDIPDKIGGERTNRDVMQEERQTINDITENPVGQILW